MKNVLTLYVEAEVGCVLLCFVIVRVSQMSNSDGARQQLCNCGAVDQAREVGCSIKPSHSMAEEPSLLFHTSSIGDVEDQRSSWDAWAIRPHVTYMLTI